jgi:hypothetical protein
VSIFIGLDALCGSIQQPIVLGYTNMQLDYEMHNPYSRGNLHPVSLVFQKSTQQKVSERKNGSLQILV